MTLILNIAMAVSLMASVPTGPGALTKNPVYKAGALPAVTCTEEAYFSDFDNTRRQAENVMTCLEQAWRPLLAKAKIPFKRAKLVVKDGDRVKACGVSGITYETTSVYCPKSKTIYVWSPVRSRKDELDRPTLLLSVARGYAYHIQQLTGIRPAAQRAFDKASKRGKKDVSLRLEMQTTCFTAAFLGSVWDSLGHTATDHDPKYVRYVLVNMHHALGFNNGNHDNAEYWAKRGFTTRSPGSCKTFSAPAKRVS
ncbi:neutral zinc metallopeptidase [Herbidospora mongoliensis]|uniref:neutral zinc metallopeptidase n=1 Tax=Herbidospora mongoliensis TaxID=688067 RepID=UPI0009FCE17B|nr:neutral zinc metallopeptidase [Herbidospora mongoliensis]